MYAIRNRVIPVLLLQDNALVKTVRFKDPKYIGDPMNAVKIFNEKEVDELVFLDISATKANREPDYELIKNLATECFMPLCYGGGIKTLEQIKKIMQLGVEKIAINSAVAENIGFLKQASDEFGSSTIVVSVDVVKDFWGKYRVVSKSGSHKTNWKLEEYMKALEENGAGELLLNSLDNDGAQQGYDLKLIELVTKLVSVPVIACGGAGTMEHLEQALTSGSSAVAAGSLFVFKGKHRAVLISYPNPEIIDTLIKTNA